MPHALVTGANGFIGRGLVPVLLAQGWQVSIVSRQSAPAGVAAHYADRDHITWSGIDTVFHLAGLAHDNVVDAAAQLTAVNVDATLSLFQQAQEAGVDRFVWLSSIKVLGETSGDHVWSIHSDKRPMDAYAHSKAEGEDGLLKLAAQGGAATTLHIVRPPLTYGPGVKANFLRLLQWAQRGAPLPLGGAVAPRAWVSLDNLCDVLVRMATAHVPGGVWHVRDAEQSSVSAMLRLMTHALHTRCWLWPLPGAATLGRWAGQAAAVDRLFLPQQVDVAETCSQLGWQPVQTQAAGLEKTAQWFQQR